MEKLVSEKEIAKEGYKKIGDRIYFKKPNNYFFRCKGCGKLTHTSVKPNKFKVIVDKCFWCANTYAIKVK